MIGEGGMVKEGGGKGMRGGNGEGRVWGGGGKGEGGKGEPSTTSWFYYFGLKRK